MICPPIVFTCERLLSAHAHDKLYSELIEAFVAVAALGDGIYIEVGRFQLVHRIGAVAAAQQLFVGGVAGVDFFDELLDFGVLLEAMDSGFEHVVGAHAAEGEVPDALLVFGAVGVGISKLETCTRSKTGGSAAAPMRLYMRIEEKGVAVWIASLLSDSLWEALEYEGPSSSTRQFSSLPYRK